MDLAEAGVRAMSGSIHHGHLMCECRLFGIEVLRRLVPTDYAVDAVTAAKALVGAWLCRRFDDGTVILRHITETEAYCGEEDTAAPRIGIAYASKRDQDRKWRFTCKTIASPAAASERSR